MYNEWFSHMSKAIQKDISFSLKVQMVQAKSIHISIYLYKNTYAMYSHKHKKMMMNNSLTSGGLNTMSFSTISIFREFVTWKVVC